MLWEWLKLRIKKILGMPLPPKPYDLIKEKEGELFGFYQSNGELLTGFRFAPTDTMVDVGCGDGGTCVFAASHGANVIAIDIDPTMIDLVNRRLRDETSSQSWQTIVSDSNPLPLQSGIATKIICQEVLEHVDDPAIVLAELVRIGKPGAQYLLTVPDPLGESVQRGIAPPCYWTRPNHLRIFEREEFDRLVVNAGLTIERRANYSFFWTMWWILFWAESGAGSFGGANTPSLRYWNKTWNALLAAPDGQRIKKALDDFMPKSQVVLARKAA